MHRAPNPRIPRHVQPVRELGHFTDCKPQTFRQHAPNYVFGTQAGGNGRGVELIRDGDAHVVGVRRGKGTADDRLAAVREDRIVAVARVRCELIRRFKRYGIARNCAVRRFDLDRGVCTGVFLRAGRITSVNGKTRMLSCPRCVVMR